MENNVQYLREKRAKILEKIKPLCDCFGIKYDYVVDYDRNVETLVLNGQEIGCSYNSINAVIDEVIIYIFVTRVAENRWLGAFHRQTVKAMKKFWKE